MKVQPMRNPARIRLVVDGSMFAIQRHGGISRVFHQLLPLVVARCPSLDLAIIVPGKERSPLPSSLEKHILRLPRLNPNLRPWRFWRKAAPVLHGLIDRFVYAAQRRGVFLSTYYMPNPTRLPSVCMVYDMIYELYPDQFNAEGDELFRATKAQAIRAANVVLCISEATRRDVMRLLDIPAPRLLVMPLAAGLSADQASAGVPDVGVDMPFLLFVGRHTADYKNFDGLVDAIEKTGSERVRKCSLVVVSTADDPRHGSLVGAGTGRFLFLRHVSDDQLAWLYAHCQAFVYPSRYEGFGIPVLEALQQGAPVVCANTSSLPEVGGSVVHYFDPQIPGGLVAALGRALAEGRDPSFVRQRQNHAATYSWERAADVLCKAVLAAAHGEDSP